MTATATRALLTAAGVVPGVAPRLDIEAAQSAVGEGLGPWLGRRLLDGAIEATPDARLLLESSYLECAARDLHRIHAADAALRCLHRRRIPVVLLKAAALDHIVYRTPGLRPRIDTDLLVPPARFAEAIRALVAHGVELVSDGSRPLTLAIYHERELRLPGGGLVDLHRHVAAWPLVAGFERRIFERAMPAPTGGALVPAGEDLVLATAVHVAQDGFRAPLRLALDCALLLSRGTLDPATLCATALEVGAAGAAARWLAALAALGVPPLGEPEWLVVRRTLAACSNPWTPVVRWGRPESIGETRRGHVLGFDSPARALTFVAYRSASLAFDWIAGRALSRLGNGTTLPTAR